MKLKRIWALNLLGLVLMLLLPLFSRNQKAEFYTCAKSEVLLHFFKKIKKRLKVMHFPVPEETYRMSNHFCSLFLVFAL